MTLTEASRTWSTGRHRPARVRRRAAHARPGTGVVGAAAAVLVPTALVGIHALAYGRWIVDDAAITFAYARSVAEGLGPVLQPGAAPVEGYSNPAWLALLVVGRWLGLFDRGELFGIPDYVLFPKVLGLLLVAVVLGAFHAAARATSRRPVLVTLVAGTAVALVPSFVIWVVSGLENALLAAAVAVLAAVLVRAVAADRLLDPRVAVAVGLLAAVAALTRPDGLIYAGAHPLVVLLFAGRGRLGAATRSALLGLTAFAVPVGAYLLWRLATFGEVLPNTALAKSQGVPEVGDLNRAAELIDAVGWLPLVLGAAAVGAVLARPTPVRRAVLALLVVLGLAVAAFVVLEPDWMGQFRFATPVWALAALVAAISAVDLASLVGGRRRVAAGVLVVVVGISTCGLALAQVERFRAAPTVPVCLVAATGRAVQAYADELGLRAGTVLTPDIGGVALTTDMVVVDTVGLAEPRIARFWREQDMRGLRDYVFDEVRPTFVTSHSVWSRQTGLLEDPRMAADYARITPTVDGGQWVRRDVLGRDGLARLRAHAAEVAGPHESAMRAAPRGSCGSTLAV